MKPSTEPSSGNGSPSAASKIIIKRPDDESMEIYLDGELLIAANHDEDGWSGMDRLKDLAEEFARVLKFAVVGD